MRMEAFWGEVLSILEFVNRGGIIVWIIIGFSFLMWLLLVRSRLEVRSARKIWIAKMSQEAKQTMAELKTIRLRKAFVRAAASAARRTADENIGWIRTIVTILPLIGLLGTVSGMIESFQSLASTADEQGMTQGISTALFTTLAGLVAALSGVFAVYRLERSVDALEHRVRTELEVDAVHS